jgi:hypothetical protein
MARMIDLKLQSSQTILKNNHEIFADIAERRSNVLRDLQSAFSKFLAREENFKDESLFSNGKSIAPNLMTGSGLAIVGAIIAALTQGAVFDITGGVLTAVGVLFAGITTTVQRRRLLKGYRTEMQQGRVRLQEEVSKKLKAYVSHIAERIDENFNQFDRHLELEKSQIEYLEKKHTDIDNRLDALTKALKYNL